MHNKLRKTGLLLGTLMAASGWATPALAQSGDDIAGGDIIVTARRSEERLQDVPISITVYSQEQISNRNIVSSADLATYTPSLSINQRYGPEKSSFSIRGFNQEQSTSPTVGVYFADVVGVRAQGGTTSGNGIGSGGFMDLQSVQVLKGPQGTLFGRNTTGGAVLLVPNKPSDRLEGWIEGQAGSYGLLRGQGVLNVPLADTFKVRVAVDRNHRDGYMRNRSGVGPDRYNNLDYFAARLSILAELTPELENYTIASYSNSFGVGAGGRILACNRAPSTNLALTATAGCAQLDRQAARGDGLRDIEISNPNPYIRLKQWQIINTTTWQATDNLTVKNIASYGQFKENTQLSLNSDNLIVQAGLPASLNIPASAVGTRFQQLLADNGPFGPNAQQQSFTEELQFQGNLGDGRLNWVAGAYLEVSRPLGWNSSQNGVNVNCVDVATFICVNNIGAGQFSASQTKYSWDNKALFAQATLKITPELSVTGGIRYTWDQVRGTAESYRILSPLTANERTICFDTLRFTNPDGSRPKVIGNFRNKAQCHVDVEVKSQRPTWLIDAEYKPVEDVMIYAKWARGYRQGGINFSSVGLETWGPEKVDAYEVGVKTSFRGGVSGYFNVAAFYNDFSDIQLFGGLVSKNTNIVAGGAAIINGGKARIQGIEVDSSISPIEGLRFELGYTYLDTKLKELMPPVLPADSPYSAVQPTAKVGAPLSLSPKHRLSLSLNYTLPLNESVGSITLGGNYVHTSRQILNASSPLVTRFQPATDLLNLNANWNRVLGSPIDLGLFVTNLTNKLYIVGTSSGLASNGYEAAMVAPPRMWGARVRYTFGAD